MSTFSYQVLKDTNQKTVIKLTGEFTDGTPESNNARIQANSLYGALDNSRANLLSNPANTGALPYYGLEITKIWYDVNMYNSSGKGHVLLYWTGTANTQNPADTTNNSPIFAASDIGNWDEHGSYANIDNNAVGGNGDIGITTTGQVANCSYTFVVELRKDNYDYSRGQIEDPAAFNYGEYSMRP
jgi:hypothetical protein